MKKILFLIPPSEWKNLGWCVWSEKTLNSFVKPISIVQDATEKDLKCTAKRFTEASKLNNENIWKWEKKVCRAIERYSWVMFKAIAYQDCGLRE